MRFPTVANKLTRPLPNLHASTITRECALLWGSVKRASRMVLKGATAACRRILDCSLAIAAIILLAPILALRAVAAIRASGHVFDSELHVGQHGESFRLLAFAGSAPAAELARLFNVLRGDLALAGPRARVVGEKRETAGAEMATRLSARPGLVSPFALRRRVGIAHQAEVEIDSEFIHTGSARGDLTLLARGGLSRILVGSGDLPAPKKLKFFNIEMSNTTMAEAVAWMTARCRQRQLTQVAFVNPDCLNLGLRDENYAAVLRNIELVLPDGIGIKIGCRMKGVAMRDNLNGTDMFPILCEAAQQQGLSVFLLGAKPGIAQATADNMQQRFTDLKVAGTHHGYFDVDAEAGVIDTINQSGADIVLVALGAPRQELFLARWKQQLQAPLRMGVGGLFDYYSGSIPRAPIWLREIGMEWVWRLMQEPGRMWRRYVIGNPAFIYRVWRESAGDAAMLRRLPSALRGMLPMRGLIATSAYLRRIAWQFYLLLSRFTKRTLDILASLLLLLVLAPLFASVALAIRTESKGPVFFKQVRVGQWGKTFPMWKFRSMRVEAEAQLQMLADQNQMDGGVIFKMKQDPRITRVGRVIRRLSIDELPQLWNVFRGDMSLVGPRPSLPSEVNLYSVEDRGRLEAKPGITCIWQVTGRSEIPFEQQVALDIEYIQTQSVSNDVSLLVKTVPAVLSGRGAY